MRYAQVVGTDVVNVILWDGETELGVDGQLINVDDVHVGVGWTYVDDTFVAPPDAEEEPTGGE